MNPVRCLEITYDLLRNCSVINDNVEMQFARLDTDVATAYMTH